MPLSFLAFINILIHVICFLFLPFPVGNLCLVISYLLLLLLVAFCYYILHTFLCICTLFVCSNKSIKYNKIQLISNQMKESSEK